MTAQTPCLPLREGENTAHSIQSSERLTKKLALKSSSLRFTKGGREGCPYLQIQNYEDIGKASVRAQNYL